MVSFYLIDGNFHSKNIANPKWTSFKYHYLFSLFYSGKIMKCVLHFHDIYLKIGHRMVVQRERRIYLQDQWPDVLKFLVQKTRSKTNLLESPTVICPNRSTFSEGKLDTIQVK
jgi:hypothetical protein